MRTELTSKSPQGGADADTGAFLQATGITKVFLTENGEPLEALRSVDLHIEHGSAVAILGPSGCGKSTLLRILGGLDADYLGDISIRPRATEKHSRGERADKATVFQADSTLPWMSVHANVEMGLAAQKLRKGERRARATEFCRLVGLGAFERSYPHELSGGMRQRVAVARALAGRPHLLLMDEPMAALDAQTRIIMQEELRRLWAETDVTVVYITHDIEEALTLADRIIVLSTRPGTICYDSANTPARAGEDVVAFRARPEVRTAATELWEVLRDQIGKSLT